MRGVKWRLFLQVVLLIYIAAVGFLWLEMFGADGNSRDQRATVDKSAYDLLRESNIEALSSTQASSSIPPRSNIIITSYMRGGSSFLGRVFGFHPDAFYIYEPFWIYSIWKFYRDSERECSVQTCKCGPVRNTPMRLNQATNRSNTNVKVANSYSMARRAPLMVEKMTKCKNFRQVVAPAMTAHYSGALWEKFAKCLCDDGRCVKPTHKTRILSHCLTLMENECFKRNHFVAKVLRLSVSMFKDVLNNTKDTKVIHLIRDPRATMNSRIKTDWYPGKSVKTITDDAKCLCERIMNDYKAGEQLFELFPDRFKVVFYEDLMHDSTKKANQLYKFAGMRGVKSIGMGVFQNITDYGFKTDHALRDSSTDYISWWRRSIEWSVLQNIDSVCSDVYSTFGYRRFTNETELRNMSLPSFEIPEQYKSYL